MMLFSGGIAASETAADSTQGDTSGAAAAAENGEHLIAISALFTHVLGHFRLTFG